MLAMRLRDSFRTVATYDFSPQFSAKGGGWVTSCRRTVDFLFRINSLQRPTRRGLLLIA